MDELPEVLQSQPAQPIMTWTGLEMGRELVGSSSRETRTALPALISYIDKGGHYRFCNKAYAEWIGDGPEQIRGKHMEEVLGRKIYHSVRHYIEAVLAGQSVSFERLLDYREVGARYVQVDYIPDLDDEGEVKGFFSLMTDLSERQWIEDERERIAVERQKLSEREHAARKQVEETNRAKDEFLAVVTHELRAPLNAMLGYARLFSKPRQFDPEEVRRAMEVIRNNGERQKILIDDLLDTARMITGKLRLVVGPVNLAALIMQTLDTVRPGAEAKGVVLFAKLDSQAGQIRGDPERLQQVVWNLLTNAIKFTPEGGRVEIVLEPVSGGVRLVISDSGEGIRADFLPHVFERFTQQDTSRTRRHGGLGLGLALVKHLVELHGGTIEAESAGQDMGATFTVCLPVHQRRDDATRPGYFFSIL